MTFTFKYLDTYWSMTFTFKYNIPSYLLITFTYSAYWCDFEFWRVSEWVSDCCLTPTQLYHGANKLIFNEMMMRSALY